MKSFVETILRSACIELWNIEEVDIKVESTPAEFEGDFTFVTFSISRKIKNSPEVITKKLGEYLVAKNKEIEKFSNIKGFLNLKLSDKFMIDKYKEIVNEKKVDLKKSGKKVLVEFSSPNTNKPLHLGHLRNNFIGQSIQRILEFVGYETHAVCVVNDRGIHICKSMIAYERYGNGETPEKTNMKGDKFVGKYYILFDKINKEELDILKKKSFTTGEDVENLDKSSILQAAQEKLIQWEKGDSKTMELWEKMNSWVYSGFEKTYQKIGVRFEKIYYESQTYLLGKEIIKAGLEQKVFYKKDDNSIWVDLTEEGLDHKLVMRSDGTSVYITQDLGMADLRYSEYAFEKCIYVVGNEQDYHFDVLFSILRKLKKPYAPNLFHLSYGMVDLPSGKMKSREGTVVDADDLIEEVETLAKEHTKRLGKVNDLIETDKNKLYHTLAMGALKYQILRVDPKKKILFNPEESIDFQGNTGPFIQYTFARICSIMQKAKEIKIDMKDSLKEMNNIQIHLLERRLIVKLFNFKNEVHKAAIDLAPSNICHYIFDLCKEYNRFYAELPVLQEKDLEKMTFRLSLSSKVKETIKKAMYLLGIDVPERM